MYISKQTKKMRNKRLVAGIIALLLALAFVAGMILPFIVY